MPKYHVDILELARRGAETRYQELKTQLDSLVKHFPHLRKQAKGPLAGSVETVKKALRGRRRKMSAEARRAISERMKKMWAARRKAKS